MYQREHVECGATAYQKSLAFDLMVNVGVLRNAGPASGLEALQTTGNVKPGTLMCARPATKICGPKTALAAGWSHRYVAVLRSELQPLGCHGMG